jgi:hypothetical protein
MRPHIESGFDPLELEQLSPDQRREVLAHIDVCQSCSAEYFNAAEALAALALALPPMQPPAALRDRILLDAGRTNRFERFVDQASRIADLDTEKMRPLLAKIDDLSSWEESPLSGVFFFPLQGGPATADAIVGFIKIKPGSSFPEHGRGVAARAPGAALGAAMWWRWNRARSTRSWRCLGRTSSTSRSRGAGSHSKGRRSCRAIATGSFPPPGKSEAASGTYS